MEQPEQEHTDDLRNVTEGDTVTIETTEGDTINGECHLKQIKNADPRTGEIRETKLWVFDTPHGEIATSIIDGLRSSDDDPEFPVHKRLWNTDEERGMGFIENIKIC